jgi:PHS family inorganic phosphate transporter-like MFS transporter
MMQLNKFFLRGLGFFNDAYDITVVNVANEILKHQYGSDVYSDQMKSNVSSAALIGAVAGQLLFGFLGDVIGRKKSMVITCALLIVGGVLSTCAYVPNNDMGTLWFLVIARGLLGVGIGGEYPLSATSASEDATSVPDRNRRVALTFSLQGVGFLAAGLMSWLMVTILDDTPSNNNIMWRTLFGLGVLPALFLIYFRATCEEPQAYKNMLADNSNNMHMTKVRWSFILRHYWKNLVGTAGTWFLFDIIFYAQNLFSSSVLATVGVHKTLSAVALQSVLTNCCALPGYLFGVYFINRMGRRTMGVMGNVFMMIAFLFLAIWWQDIKTNTTLFLFLFGLTLFFANFGPNMSTFIAPTEMFPTAIRSTCHGFSAAMGKAGASVGSYGFSIWSSENRLGMAGTWYLFAAIAFISIVCIWFFTFDNNDEMYVMDNEFKAKLALEGDETRMSFSKEVDMDQPLAKA